MANAAPTTPPSPTQAIGPDGTTRTISDHVVRRVWVTAGGRCTMCNRYLLDDEHTGAPVSIGQLAHIVGWTTTSGSPRGNDSLDAAERNLEGNLMLLCYDQHRVVDNRSMWEIFDADTLRAMKRTHERRIKQLTALHDEERTTVLRMVGNLHGAGVELSPRTVATALLADGRYPDYALLGVDDYEIDLRTLPGEPDGRPGYWSAARDLIEDRLQRLTAHIGKENIRHLSVFPLARVPLLLILGTLLDDTVPTVIYPKRRSGDEGWGWTPGSPDVDFTHSRLRPGADPRAVAVLFSLSGTIDPDRLPAGMDDATVYELRPDGIRPNPDLMGSQSSLDRFGAAWRALLAELEHEHPGLAAINVFAAVPVTAAVTIGRGLMRAAHPPLRIYDRDTHNDRYEFALESTR